ncbi:aspartyl/asparaginyl beta-hydroxylase domain-containing protein [Pseudoalteromonas piscicida]|uniref:aspartyl/asparaginyl beta-hydroxylase domain-containing protein n=1 Tax=Pseudoalteromonas piscicida TaxID=43662 RepID=UPI0030B7188B
MDVKDVYQVARYVVAEKLNLIFSRVKGGPYFEKEQFAWLSEIENNWEVIRDEVVQLIERENQLVPHINEAAKSAVVEQPGKWGIFYCLFGRKRVEANCAHLPKTMEIMENVPNPLQVWVSIMAPERHHIARHTDFYNGVLRMHLPLVVPTDGRCEISVGDQISRWKEGSSIIFDPTYPHEVWKDANEYRAMLIVDFQRPLPNWLKRIGNKIYLDRLESKSGEQTFQFFEAFSRGDVNKSKG